VRKRQKLRNKGTMFLCLMMAVSILSCVAFLYEAYDLKKERDWFYSLSTDWYLFEKDYREDIKNIDQLRDDLEWNKDVCNQWQRICIEFSYEALDWKMKHNMLYGECKTGI